MVKDPFEIVANLSDQIGLRNMLENAKGDEKLVLACQVRLAKLKGAEYNSSVEKEFWLTLNLMEEFMSQERGKPYRSVRTRQKEKRVGCIQCLKDWAISPKVTEGFDILLNINRPELSGEAIVLRHPEVFGADLIEAARRKFLKYDVDLQSVLRPLYELHNGQT